MNTSNAGYERKFDVLDGLFLGKNPALPLGGAIRHASQDDPGYLQSRISETNCGSYIVRRVLLYSGLTCARQRRTILHLGSHCESAMRSWVLEGPGQRWVICDVRGA